MPAHRSTPASFWDKSIPEPNSGCWIWLGAIHHAGGGMLYGVACWRNTRVLAHRLAWELSNGRIPDRVEVVRHRCDTPLCVNPEHLLIGSQADNMADMLARGRHWASRGIA
jgi:hypothetical protein